MAYYIFHIPSLTIPEGLTKINESIFCFPSKEINTASDYDIHKQCICVAISAENEIRVLKLLKDFIITLNVFHFDNETIGWFSRMSLEKYKLVNDSIEHIYFQYKSVMNYPFMHYDFNNMLLHLFAASSPKLSFIDVYNKLILLKEDDFIYTSLCFLSIINPITTYVGKIYNNALLENALQFQLFETIMNEYDPDDNNLITYCIGCKRPNKRGISKKIDDFFILEEYKSINDKQDFINSAKKIAKTRHKFFHNLKGKSRMDYYTENIAPNIDAGSIIYLKEDIKYGDGTFNAIHNMKTLNTLILLGKLLDE